MTRLALAVLTVLALAGCGVPVSTTGAPATETRLYTSGGDSTEATEDAEPEASESSQVGKIGETITYRDGLKVTVVSAKRFRIGKYAAGGEPGGTGVVLTITLANGTGQAFDAGLTSVNLAYGDAGDQADKVFDSDAGLGSGFSGKVQPGRKATARFGFAVPAGGMRDLQIEVLPGFLDHESVLFSGAA